MSVDLKGNTNFACFKNLQDEYIVPRTNLAAVDMETANGVKVNGNTISLELADPLQLTTAADGSGAVTAEVLGTALRFARDSVFDVTTQGYILTGNSATVTDEDGVRTITAVPEQTGTTQEIGITFNGPLPVIATTPSLYLIVVDVKTGDLPANSITLSSTGTQIPVTNYDTTTTTTNIWTRLAFVLDATAQSYTGNIKLTAVFPEETTETALIYKNLYVVNVIDLTAAHRDELASVIGTDAAYIWKPGYGVKMSGGTISMDLPHASVPELINNSDDNLMSTKGFTGALSSGKAVDVTSTPHATVGSINTGIGIKGHIVWTASSGGTFGFYETDDLGGDSPEAFPKYAAGLVYLMLADVTNTGTDNVTITAANALNGTLPVTITPGSMVRIAFLFDTSTTGYFTVTAPGSISLEFDYLREFEVTGCSNEARNYIAALTNPDDYTKFYLVNEDEVNPWLYIINMKSSPSVTLQAGLAYKIYANDGATHELMVDTIPPETYGRDAHIELYIADTGTNGTVASVKLIPPLRLAKDNAFTANTLNNCSVRFQDGLATLTIDSVEDIFIVNLAGGTYTTEAGTLYAGLAVNTGSEIAFNSGTNELECNMYNATVNGNKKLFGNGVDKTIVIGTASLGSTQVEMRELQLKGATISGGTTTFAGTVAINDTLTANSAIKTLSAATGTTHIILAGASTSPAAITGTGTLKFADGDIIDASQNKTGSIVVSMTNNDAINVPTSSTVTFIRPNGVEAKITGNISGKYLLSTGSITNSIYIVSVATGSGNNTLAAGLTSSTTNIVFANSLSGTAVSVDGVTTTVFHNIIGDGIDKTTIVGGTVYTNGAAVSVSDATWEVAKADGANVGDINLTSCKVTNLPTNSATYGVSIQAHSGQITNCEITGNTVNYSVLNNGYFYNCYIYNNQAAAILGTPVLIKDCVISGNTGQAISYSNVASALSIENTLIENNTGVPINVWNSRPSITGSTLSIGGTSVSVVVNRSSALDRFAACIFKGKNIVKGTIVSQSTISRIYAPIEPNSILDLSENSNVQCANFVGGMIYVGTLSNSGNTETVTVSGTASVIPYGETEPVTISGSGNALLNTGKLGFLVKSTYSSNANNDTLYDALVGDGTAYSNVIFYPVTDTHIISLPVTTDPMVVRDGMTIDGNGTDKTMISGYWKSASGGTGWTTVIKNVLITGATYSGVPAGLENCVVTNMKADDNYAFKYGSVKNCIITGNTAHDVLWPRYAQEVSNCTFTANSVGLIMDAYAGAGVNLHITGCTFTNNTAGNQIHSLSKNSYITYVDSCYFNNPSLDANSHAIRVEAANQTDVVVTGNTFASTADTIYMTGGTFATITFSGTNVLNSTVSGAGTIVFANDCTISSTDGNGVISGSSVVLSGATPAASLPITNATLSNLTITGTTSTLPSNFLFYQCHVTGCTITNNKLIGASTENNYPRMFTNCEITGSTFSGNIGWITIGGGTITDSVIRQSVHQHGALTLSGTVTTYDIARAGGGWDNGFVHIIRGSSITCYAMDVRGGNNTSTISVGYYDDAHVWHIDGTATVKVNNKVQPLIISGSGTYILTDGTTDMTVVS